MKSHQLLPAHRADETLPLTLPAAGPDSRRLDDLRPHIAISHAYTVSGGAVVFRVNIIRSGGTRRFQLTHASPPPTKRKK